MNEDRLIVEEQAKPSLSDELGGSEYHTNVARQVQRHPLRDTTLDCITDLPTYPSAMQRFPGVLPGVTANGDSSYALIGPPTRFVLVTSSWACACPTTTKDEFFLVFPPRTDMGLQPGMVCAQTQMPGEPGIDATSEIC